MSPLLPPATIGIIGGGQLGMMAIREAQRMGYSSVVWDPDPECPAARLADHIVTAPYSDAAAAEQMCALADVVTYEFEHIDVGTVEMIERRKPVFPGHDILEVSQHREREKAELSRHGFPVVHYRAASTPEECAQAIEELGLPVVAKTATAGYDGKGQTVLRTQAQVEEFLGASANGQRPYVIEQFVDLLCEVSVLVARGHDGRSVTLPVSENIHVENILHTSIVPARIDANSSARAVALAREIAERFAVVGLLCVEMFVTRSGETLVNELAPRPHNSFHFSLDACDISQFEMFVRTLCRLPLPSPRLLSSCAMVNILGKHLAHLDIAALSAIPGMKLHLYGKKRIEPKRKMGHLTILRETPAEVMDALAQVERMIVNQPLEQIQHPIARATGQH